MVKIDDFVVTSVAYNITEMSNEQLQKLAFLLSGSVGESLCDYLTFAIQDAQNNASENMEMETI
jgi:hypothetical protein